MNTKLLALGLATIFAGASLLQAGESQVIPLWANGAPGFESRRNEPEQAQSYWVRNIHNPSVTVFLPPKDKANGAAVLICPGGGHRELVYQAEGVEPAMYFTNLGVAAFVLKYRLAREEGSPYSLQKHPLEDSQRAMRLIRSKATEWNLDTKRIGAVGFSAGGEVVSELVYHPTAGDPNAADPIDRTDCTTSFQIVIYPGPLGIPDKIGSDAPPAFFLVSDDDTGHLGPVLSLVEKYRDAGRPMEVHIFAKGGHGFNMGNRSKITTIKNWPQRMTDWMTDTGILTPAPKHE